MGLGSNAGQVIFKMTHVVACELDLMLDLVESKNATNVSSHSSTITRRSINCDISNIVHKFLYHHHGLYTAALVRSVAIFLKQLAADTGYVITPIFDGDVRPQTKRDTFHWQYTAFMSKMNAFYC